MDSVEVVEEEITAIKDKISFLESLHRKHLLPGFDDRGGEEYSIEKTSNEIMTMFSNCQKKIKNIPGSSQNQAKIVGKNIQTSLATKLQETSSTFKKIQSDYLSKLKAREKTTTLGKETLTDSNDIDVRPKILTNRYLQMLKFK